MKHSNTTTWTVRDSNGDYHDIPHDDLLAAAKDCIRDRFSKGETISNPADSARYFQVLIGDKDHEVFTVAWLDNRHRIIGHSELFRGTIDGASVYPREIVKEALAHNAAAVILAHNHPSGVAEPSRSDIGITERLKEALALVDVRILDHLIVGDSVISLAERGMI